MFSGPPSARKEPMTETIDKAEFLRLARAAGFYHYDMPDVEGQDLGQSLEADGRGTVDRLVASLQAHIKAALAAAEARNATLTDDAARWQYAMDWNTTQFAVCFLDGMGWTPINNDGPIDQAMAEARAAASISTKGDGP